MAANAAGRGVHRRGARSAASSPTTRYPADFLYDNLMIEANVIHAALPQRRREAAVPRLLLHLSASSRRSRSREDALLTGPLEPTNEWYAIAKIAGIKLVPGLSPAVRLRLHLGDADQSLRPRRQLSTSQPATSLPALIRKAHEAKLRGAPSVAIWGTRHAAARIPACRRSAPMPWSS